MFRSRREFFLLFQGNEVLLLLVFSRGPFSMGLKTEKEGRKEARQPCPLFIIKTNGVAPHDKTAKTQLERDNKRSISTPMYAHHLTLIFCLRSKSSRCHFYKNSFSCHVNTAIHCLRLGTR